VSIEPFRNEIAPDVFLSGVPLGTNVPGFSFIKICDACGQDILTWKCYDPEAANITLRSPMIS